MPVGLASNSPRRFVERTLRPPGCATRFGAVVGADEVEHPSPRPTSTSRLRGAGRRSGARASALEDSPTGVAAARAAGLFVIGVPSLDGIALDEADLVAAALARRDPVVLGRGL